MGDLHPATMISLIVGGAFTLAWVSVVLSTKSATPNVIGAAAGGLGTIIGYATAPITGQAPNTGSNLFSASPNAPTYSA